jgi:hypothetical protein
MSFVAKAKSGAYTVVADPRNLIVESNENNNSATFSESTATPPASCPPVQPGDSTPTPQQSAAATQVHFGNSKPTPTLDEFIQLPVFSQLYISTVLPQQYPIPSFTAPEDWLIYTNLNAAYEIHYPPSAKLNMQELDKQRQATRLTISLPVQPDTQMIEKHIIIDTHSSPGGCYTFGNGVTPINGVEFTYLEGKFWDTISDHTSDPRDIFQSQYNTIIPHNGFCYRILLEVTKQHDPKAAGATSLPTPSQSDTDVEILLNILSTLMFH